MTKILIILSLFSISTGSFGQISVETGMVIQPTHINSLQTQATAIQAELTALKDLLKNKTIRQEFPLWIGNLYLDGSSVYSLWNANQHQTWDSIEMHVAYDSGSTAQIVEVVLGPSYTYNSTNIAQSILFTTYDTTYRRVAFRTNGIDVWDGNGTGWHLKKVVGIKTTIIP